MDTTERNRSEGERAVQRTQSTQHKRGEMEAEERKAWKETNRERKAAREEESSETENILIVLSEVNRKENSFIVTSHIFIINLNDTKGLVDTLSEHEDFTVPFGVRGKEEKDKGEKQGEAQKKGKGSEEHKLVST